MNCPYCGQPMICPNQMYHQWHNHQSQVYPSHIQMNEYMNRLMGESWPEEAARQRQLIGMGQ